MKKIAVDNEDFELRDKCRDIWRATNLGEKVCVVVDDASLSVEERFKNFSGLMSLLINRGSVEIVHVDNLHERHLEMVMVEV